MAKGKWKVDPPTRTVTISGVSSVIVDQFNELIEDRKIETGKSRTEIFEEIVMGERRKDVGQELVQSSINRYHSTQEKIRRLVEPN